MISQELDLLDSAAVPDDLHIPPGNRLERLVGNRSGQHSIRVNDRYRICLVWTESRPDEVEITDYY
ncbi:MAG: plasmid maintenance system killer protein [Dehalococcoidia bacterium]|nr:plasmid maintenance system killer protein [Dehalococcoidia bacterium]MYG81510.1 plasmid maintenance system killer protein [Gemmatimonadota bacterium]